MILKKLFAIVLTLILAFSSFGITAPQSVSANTSLAGTYYISASHSGKVPQWKMEIQVQWLRNKISRIQITRNG